MIDISSMDAFASNDVFVVAPCLQKFYYIENGNIRVRSAWFEDYSLLNDDDNFLSVTCRKRTHEESNNLFEHRASLRRSKYSPQDKEVFKDSKNINSQLASKENDTEGLGDSGSDYSSRSSFRRQFNRSSSVDSSDNQSLDSFFGVTVETVADLSAVCEEADSVLYRAECTESRSQDDLCEANLHGAVSDGSSNSEKDLAILCAIDDAVARYVLSSTLSALRDKDDDDEDYEEVIRTLRNFSECGVEELESVAAAGDEQEEEEGLSDIRVSELDSGSTNSGWTNSGSTKSGWTNAMSRSESFSSHVSSIVENGSSSFDSLNYTIPAESDSIYSLMTSNRDWIPSTDSKSSVNEFTTSVNDSGLQPTRHSDSEDSSGNVTGLCCLARPKANKSKAKRFKNDINDKLSRDQSHKDRLPSRRLNIENEHISNTPGPVISLHPKTKKQDLVSSSINSSEGKASTKNRSSVLCKALTFL